MQNTIEEIFLRIQEKKNERKELKQICKDVLDSSQQYQEIQEQMKALREKRKQVMSAAQAQCNSELIEIDQLTEDIKTDEELLTDMAITKYTNGESIELSDKYENNYEPVFSVKFKKVN